MDATEPLDDHELARSLAEQAGDALLGERRRRGFGDTGALRNAGDRIAHDLLVARIGRERPGDAVLSEEGADDPARLSAERVWIVDPLDGTREFAEDGRVDWAVHVALWERGELVAGAVALPGEGVTLYTGAPPRAARIRPDAPRLVVSRTRPPAFVDAVAAALGGVTVPLGSAGAKVAAVIRGTVDVYVHAGGQYEWDSAAPVAVARAAGLHTSRLDGSPLEYNQPNPWLPDLCVCPVELAPAVLAAVAATREPTLATDERPL